MKKYLVLAGAVVLIALGLFFVLKSPTDSVTFNPKGDEVFATNQDVEQSKNIPEVSQPNFSLVYLSFDFGTEKKSFEISTDGQENLFELIQKTELQIETENFPPIGKMIVSINGFKNGTDGKYWQFWINGKYAQIGVSAYEPKLNDSIEWKFTKDNPD